MATPGPLVPAHRPRRSGKLYWAVLAFLVGFSILLIAVSRYYLLPAFDAARTATPIEKKQLAAVSALLLAIVLFVTVVGLLLVFRYGKLLLPHRGGGERPRTPTTYTDAWAEAGRRFSQRPDGSSSDRPDPE